MKEYLKGLYHCLDELSRQDVEGVVDVIFAACQKGKHVFIMGNGGSATTASHLARDLKIGTAINGKRRVRAISLTDNPALVTAIANDAGYAFVFEEQLIGHVAEGDVVIAISASGNSVNVLRAVEFGRKNGAITIGFTGFSGGKLMGLVDRCITVSSRDYGQVEDVHMSLAHIISYLVRKRIINGE